MGGGEFFNLDINGDGNKDVGFRIRSTHTTRYISNYAYVVGGGYYSVASVRNPYNNKIMANGAPTFSAKNLNLSSPVNTVFLSYFGVTKAFLGASLANVYSGRVAAGGNFLDSRGFLGVGFDIPGGSPHFGWIDLALSSDASQITIYAWGWETVANTGIQAGAGQESQPVPEPATLVTLAMGAAGIYGWRRKRKRKGVKNDS